MDQFGVPSVSRSCDALRQDIHRALAQYADGNWVDWRNSEAFERDVCSAIRRASESLLAREAWDTAFAVSLSALEELRHFEVDSDVFTQTAISSCLDVWRCIADRGGEEGKRIVVEGGLAFLRTRKGRGEPGDTLEFEKEDAEGYLVERFADDPAWAGEVRKIAERHLRELASAPSRQGNPWALSAQERERGRWACVCLRTMRTMGATKRERADWGKAYLVAYAVRNMLVDDALEQGEINRACELLRDGRTCTDYSDRADLERRLLSLSREAGDVEEVRTCLRVLVGFEPSDEDGLARLEELHELVGDEEWPTEREVVLSATRDTHRHCVLLAHEGLFDELMDELEHCGTYELDAFREILGAAYAPRIVALYRKGLDDRLRYASSRKDYREALSYLRRIGETPGGEEAFTRLANELRSKNQRRPAFLDELAKIGG